MYTCMCTQAQEIINYSKLSTQLNSFTNFIPKPQTNKMYSSNQFDPSRRRRRARPPQPSPLSTAAAVATAAALAYGAYRLGSHVWNNMYLGHDGYDSDSGNEDEFECWDQQRGRNADASIEDRKSNYRSRRSRGDWSELNHRRRSHRPSPGEGYVHTPSSQDNDISPIVRNARMNRCRTETSRAMVDFLPTLKKAVVQLTDVSAETEELKQLRLKRKESDQFDGGETRDRERELWNVIKNKSVTRLVTTGYAHTIVFLVLTVQVNLLGGRLLREESGEYEDDIQREDTSDRYRSSHQLVLAKTYEHVFANGIPALEKAVSKIVEKVVEDWDVLGSVDNGSPMQKKDSVSIQNVSDWLDEVRMEIERTHKDATPTSALAAFIIPNEDEIFDNNQDRIGNTETTTDDLAKYILDETYDLLESPIFANSELTCLDATFTQLRSNGYANLFEPSAIGNDTQSVPLAAAITHFQRSTVSTFYKPPSRKAEIESWGGVLGMMEEPLPSEANVYIPLLERLDAVLELGNVCFD